jgi:hypothetical protein
MYIDVYIVYSQGKKVISLFAFNNLPHEDMAEWMSSSTDSKFSALDGGEWSA